MAKKSKQNLNQRETSLIKGMIEQIIDTSDNLTVSKELQLSGILDNRLVILDNLSWDIFEEAIIEASEKGNLKRGEVLKLRLATINDDFKKKMNITNKRLIFFNGSDQTKELSECYLITKDGGFDIIKEQIAENHALYIRDKYNVENSNWNIAKQDLKDYIENVHKPKKAKWSTIRHKNKAYRIIKNSYSIDSIRKID